MSSSFVEIIEVGPRDGLQNEPIQVSTDDKKKLIEKLHGAGIMRMETTAFVNPKVVPQMSDSEEIAHFCNELGIHYIALTPNKRAIEKAADLHVPEIAVFIGASTMFNKKNINKSTEESLEDCKEIFKIARCNDMRIRGYISMAFHCPYQGKVSFEEVDFVCKAYAEQEIDEIVVGDTSGYATPQDVYEVLSKLMDKYPRATFVGHFHDTKNRALENTKMALEVGLRKFDSSIGGLGGCPFSPGALGNVATESVVELVHSAGYETNLHLPDLLEIQKFAKSLSTRF